MNMGCFPSKKRRILQRQADYGSSSDDDQLVENQETRLQTKVGITPISSSSEEDYSPKKELPNPFQLVENLVVGIQEISDDESSAESNCSNLQLFGSPDATFTSTCRDNQSMNDIGDDSIVDDWLAESITTLFTSTTLGGSVGDEEKQHTHRQAARPESESAQNVWSSPAWRAPERDRRFEVDTSEDEFEHVLPLPKQVAEHEEAHLHTVIDTTRVERRHAPLPSNTPTSAIRGSWLTNRYCVNDYIVLSELGTGAHSEVRLCKHKKSNELFAIKIMNRKLMQSKIVDFQKEVAIMKALLHPNILRLYEVLDDPKVNKVYLITEFAHRGDLMNVMKINVNTLSDSQLQDIVRQVMRGLQYLHQQNIVHNDMKPSNLLITSDGTVKIADFGVSGTGRVRLDSAGTPAFMAPEVVTGIPHDGRLADSYALGATMFCIKFGRPPFMGRGGQKNQKLLDLYDQIKHAPLLFPDPVDSALRDLISKLMRKDPMRRIRLTNALNHPWLRAPG